jgi:hypothetical protein
MDAINENDVSKRGKPKRVRGFIEQKGLAPVPPHRGRLHCYRLKICLARIWRSRVSGCTD